MRSADVVAASNATVVTISNSALEHASESCRMQFYRSFLDVIAARLNAVNSRLSKS